MLPMALEVASNTVDWGATLGAPAQAGLTDVIVSLIPYGVPVLVLMLAIRIGPKVFKKFAN